MATMAKNAILRAKIEGVLHEIMVKTTAGNVYMADGAVLETYIAGIVGNVTDLQEAYAALGALAAKDKVTQDDLDTALAELIGSKAAQADLTELAGRVTTAEGAITTLVGEDAGKSARTIANEELAKQLIPETAAEALDTLEEIAKWIQDHPGDASAMNAAITALQNKVDTGDQTVTAYVTAAINALNIGDYAKAADLTELAGRVTTAEQDIAGLKQTVEGLGDLAQKDTVGEGDLDAGLLEKVNASAEGNHSHANKTVLDGITADHVAAWNGKANIYYAAEEPAGLTENDLWVQLID